MKVVILAAGYANRLRSVTNNGEIAKTLLPIDVDGNPRPILYHLLEKIEKIKNPNDVPYVDEVIVVVNDKYKNQLREAINAYQSKLKITFVSDGSNCPENAKGANYAMRCANDIIPQNYHGDIMVLASDNYFEFDLFEMLGYFGTIKDHYGDDINLVASKQYPDEDREYIAKNFGILNIDQSNQVVLGLDEKPGIENLKSNNVSLALYVFNRLDFNLIGNYMDTTTDPKKRDNMGCFLDFISQVSTLFNYTCEGVFRDIGTPAEYYELAPNNKKL